MADKVSHRELTLGEPAERKAAERLREESFQTRKASSEAPHSEPSSFEAAELARNLYNAKPDQVGEVFRQAALAYRAKPDADAQKFAHDLNHALLKEGARYLSFSPFAVVADKNGLVRLEDSDIYGSHIVSHAYVGSSQDSDRANKRLMFDTADALQTTTPDATNERRDAIVKDAIAQYQKLRPDLSPSQASEQLKSQLLNVVAKDRAWSMDHWGWCAKASRQDVQDALGLRVPTDGDALGFGKNLGKNPNFERVVGELKPGDIVVRAHGFLGKLYYGAFLGRPDPGHAFVYAGPDKAGGNLIAKADGSLQINGSNYEDSDHTTTVTDNSWYWGKSEAFRYKAPR